MKDKKAFTLVELLAVIVILSVIALIATPLILNIIEEARYGSFKDSVYGALKASKIALANENLEDYPNTKLTINFSTGSNVSKLGLNGSIPKAGYLVIDEEGRTELLISDNRYCAKKSFGDDDITIEKYDAANCKTWYKEDILNGADPILKDNLIPVIISDDGTVKKADILKQWYKYENKEWANAVILKDGKTVESDNTIKEENIKEYYVWIPKYAYKLWNVDSNNTENVGKPIEIVFGEKATTTGTDNGDMYIHPAFTNFNTYGIWVGKFEISYDEESFTKKDTFLKKNPNYSVATDSSKLIVKPNTRSLTNKKVSDFYKLIKNSHQDLNSHMMTNMEWGAVAYLTYSKYGRCNEKTCTEVTINNINTGYYRSSAVFSGQWEYGATITGCAADTVSAGVISNVNECTNKYNTTKGYLASTTGKISGIYDMSGGNWEYVMGVLENASGKLYSGRNSKYNSGFKGLYGCPTCNSDTSGLTENTTGLDFPNNKYYDSYISSDEIGTNVWYKYTSGKLGDATKEIANTKENSLSGDRGLWFNDLASFPSLNATFFIRGSRYIGGMSSGVLTFGNCTGISNKYISTRSVLAF
ncbi:MAG: type II secretion system protein [Bacilli bacterium]|nr:type II secretion system protein [Bacilli bacterium]